MRCSPSGKNPSKCRHSGTAFGAAMEWHSKAMPETHFFFGVDDLYHGKIGDGGSYCFIAGSCYAMPGAAVLWIFQGGGEGKVAQAVVGSVGCVA